MNKQKTSHDALVSNLRTLMKAANMSGQTFAQKSGVSIRMINSIFSGERTPTVRVVDKLAAVFNLAGWQILTPNLPNDLTQAKQLANTVNNFLHASGDGKQYIAHVAEKEAEYNIHH